MIIGGAVGRAELIINLIINEKDLKIESGSEAVRGDKEGDLPLGEGAGVVLEKE